MQNKQPHSDWQQENAGKNLVWFVKYWPLGCQTVKWEIIKKKNNPNQPPHNPLQIIITKKSTTAIFYLFQKQDNYLLYTSNWKVIFVDGRVFFFFFFKQNLNEA